jgi:hypothetical protein
MSEQRAGGSVGKVTIYDAETSAVLRELLDKLDDREARIVLLRALLTEALAGWEAAGTWSQGDPRLDLERILEIRREAGL